MTPEIIHQVAGLSLLARLIADGGNPGIQSSRNLGQGIEFSQYRGYEPGDDLRLLDWKMLARSGRYYIKQAEVESNITVKFILDASNSMQHTEDSLSKMDFARVLIAALGYLCEKQGDSFGLFARNEKKLYTLTPKMHIQQYKHFLNALINIRNDGRWPQHTAGLELMHGRGEKELFIFVTDLHEHEHELIEVLKSLKTNRNEVIALQLMAPKELNFAYSGAVTLEDLETGSRMQIDAEKVKKNYLKSLKQRHKALKEELLSSGVSYHQILVDDDPGTALRLFLKIRKNML